MKTLFTLLSLSLGSFTYADVFYFGFSERQPLPENPCNTETYKDFINKPGVHLCNLQDADLSGKMLSEANFKGANFRNADLSNADLSNADLRGALLYIHTESKSLTLYGKTIRGVLANIGIIEEYSKEANLQNTNINGAIVTLSQAEYLEHIGLSGFIVGERYIIEHIRENYEECKCRGNITPFNKIF